MNNIGPGLPAESHSLLLLDELTTGQPISQREISGRLGIALGLVNSYLKTLVHKGFVQVKTCPRNRYAYLLTPTGMAEKSQYIYQQVAQYHHIFQHTRQDSLGFFLRLHGQGVREVCFCGVDEFTEIAYLSLREAQIGLIGIFDDRRAGERFIDQMIMPLAGVAERTQCAVIITALREPERYRDELLRCGLDAENIYMPISERI